MCRLVRTPVALVTGFLLVLMMADPSLARPKEPEPGGSASAQRSIAARTDSVPDRSIARSKATAPYAAGSSNRPVAWWSAIAVGATLALLALVHFLLRRGALTRAGGSPLLRVVGRLPLGARSVLCVVRVGDRLLLVGTGSQGPPALLGEINEAAAVTSHRDQVTLPMRVHPSPEALSQRDSQREGA